MDFPIKNCDFPWQNVRSPGVVIGFDPSTRHFSLTVLSLQVLPEKAQAASIEPLCPKTRSVPEESNGLSSSGWWF